MIPVKHTKKSQNILKANHLTPDGIETRKDGTVDDGASGVGRVRIGKGSVITRSPAVRGPPIIRESSETSLNADV